MTKILVIEDENLILENILELLNSENFEVLAAENGKEGIKLAEQHQPNLILCDVMMPEIDGYKVLAEIRNHPVTATTPFILMTALTERKNQRQGMELGADDYITKPCTATELLKAVFTQLEKYSILEKRYESKIKAANQSHYLYKDSLTKLPNRLALRDKFNQIKIRLESDNKADNLRSILIPVFGLKLDRFNRINENFGYEDTDLLLKNFADLLSNSVGKNSIVARLTTDEFAIIIEPIGDLKIEKLAQTILKAIQKPFWINNQEIFITASIGIACYPRDAKDIETLLRHCKQAMKYAQQRGGNCYDFYLTTFDVDIAVLELETYLHYALEREEFQLYYEPKVNLKTGKISGGEALLRWHHPQKGFISPGKFIPIAEESGLIGNIGEWVLKKACQQIKAWQKKGLGLINVAVNLSGSQFNQVDLRTKLVKIILEVGVDPKYIELELTENILVQNVEESSQKLRDLKALGLSIAVDDFGTGYSSLSYLQKFPFDSLKIDECFVCNIDTNTTNQAITKAVISLAHQLNLKVIAEGVETESELVFLYDHGCDEIQGSLFSPALPVAEFEKLVISGKSLQIEK